MAGGQGGPFGRYAAWQRRYLGGLTLKEVENIQFLAAKLYCTDDKCEGNMHPAQCPVTEVRDVLSGSDLSRRWCSECETFHDVLHCPKCGREMEGDDLSAFVVIPDDRKEKDRPAPRLPQDLMAVYVAYGELLVGESGYPSVMERERLLCLMGITEPSELETWWELWGRISSAKAIEDRRRQDALIRKSKGK